MTPSRWQRVLVTTSIITATGTGWSLYGLATGDYGPVFVFWALMAAAVVYATRAPSGHLLPLFFAVNSLFALALAMHFTDLTGEVFAFRDRGDDRVLFEGSVEITALIRDGRWREILTYSQWSGFGFIVVGGALHTLAGVAGDPSPLSMRIANSFVGATVPVAAFHLWYLLDDRPDRRRAMAAAFLAGSFPIMIYYAGMGVRDAWVGAASLWVVYFGAVIKLDVRLRSTAWVGAVCALVIVALFRPLSVLPLLAFGGWLFLDSTNRWGGLAAKATVIIAGILTLRMLGPTLAVAGAYERAKYADLTLSQAGPDSLGAQILQLGSPLGDVVRTLYALYAPVPPPHTLRADALLIGAGAAAWYFVIPLAGFGLAGLLRRPGMAALGRGLGVYLAISLVGIGLTSVDFRHKLPIYPLGIVLALLGAWHLRRRSTWMVTGATLGFIATLGLVYLYLKGGL